MVQGAVLRLKPEPSAADAFCRLCNNERLRGTAMSEDSESFREMHLGLGKIERQLGRFDEFMDTVKRERAEQQGTRAALFNQVGDLKMAVAGLDGRTAEVQQAIGSQTAVLQGLVAANLRARLDTVEGTLRDLGGRMTKLETGDAATTGWWGGTRTTLMAVAALVAWALNLLWNMWQSLHK